MNGTPVPIFALQLTTVAEALLAAGIQPRSFFGKPGSALTFEWNGEMQVIKGTLGNSAELLVNGKPGKLDQSLTAGDEIIFIPGEHGKDAQISVKDILPVQNPKWIFWNGERERYAPQVFVNHKLVLETDHILDGNKISYIANDDLSNLLKQKGYNLQEKEDLEISVNGEIHTFHLLHEVLVNGNTAEGNIIINDGDCIEVRKVQLTIGDLKLKPNPITFYINGKEMKYPTQETIITSQGRPVQEDELLIDGMDLRVVGYKQMPILSDLLPYVKFSDEVPPGSTLTLIVNGQPAEFTTVLCPGDRLTATWN